MTSTPRPRRRATEASPDPLALPHDADDAFGDRHPANRREPDPLPDSAHRVVSVQQPSPATAGAATPEPTNRWESIVTVYQPGQRVVLVHTSDPHTDLRPGDTGTVRRQDQHRSTVHIDWDTGSRLSMCLDAGDRIQPLTDATPGTQQPSGDTDGWAATLARLAAAGAEAGRGVAEWWAQDTIGGRATGDVRATARRVLAGIDDGDPAVLDGLPTFTPPVRWHDGRDTAELRYTEAAHHQAPDWRDLTDAQRAETIDTSQEAFDTAVVERVVELCRLAASPTGTDVSHLHPEHVRIGRIGVFSGDWAWTVDAAGADRIAVGFVGTLIDRWNGWAVFSCTREVAEAIVADQQEHRRELRESLQRQGVPEPELDQRVNAELTDLRFDGDVIIADQRAQYDDPEAIERISPDREGQYVVMGWNWCWEAVAPHDCDRIVGDLPAPGAQQQFVELPHTRLRVPHDRLRVSALQAMPETPGTSLATLALDGTPVAAAMIAPDGSHMSQLTATFGRKDWAAFLSSCRHHGRPASEGQVLDALATECQVTDAVHLAAADGGVLTRLLGADGTVLRLRPVWPAPIGHHARMRLGQRLRRENPHPQTYLWQLWTGTEWKQLAGPADLDAAADTRAEEPNAGQVLAFVIADSLYERLDRRQLIEQAARDGIPLDPQMDEDQMRALLRDTHREEGRQAGLPVDDLPTLSAADGLELGRIAAGGTPADQ